MPDLTNILGDIPPTIRDDELLQTLLITASLRIERIVSHGHHSPAEFWYDQPRSEWVLLIQGAARLRFDDRVLELRTGDFVEIPAHQRHQVEWTTPDEPTIWLAIHHD